MTQQEITKHILEIKIIPVIRVSSSRLARQAAEAVLRSGISILEITMTVPGAVPLIAELVKELGSEALVGAGTVLDVAAAKECLDAGAEFLVSPGFDATAITEAKRRGKVSLAGALTPTEVLAAWRCGCDFVKVFPCSALGGASYIKSLKGPFPEIPLVPTGGVNLDNAADLIRAGASALGIGSELVSPTLVAEGHLDHIVESGRKLIAIVRRAAAPGAGQGS